MAGPMQQIDLLQSIQSQIDIQPVNYDHWQRDKNRALNISTLLENAANAASAAASEAARTRIGSACSSICNHPWVEKKRLTNDKDNAAKSKLLKELRTKIDLLRKSLQQLQATRDSLRNRNCNLLREIEESDKSCFESANSSLRTYERSEKSLSAMGKLYGLQKTEAVEALEKLKKETHEKLSNLQSRIDTVEQQLASILTEVEYLKSYEHIEYPRKSAKISELQLTLENLRLNQEVEVDQLDQIINLQRNQRSSEAQSQEEFLAEAIGTHAIDAMDPHTKNLAGYNRVLIKERQTHWDTITGLQEEIERLKAENRDLVYRPECHIRPTMFPELHKTFPKCQPDDDLLDMDIPVKPPLKF